MRSKQGAVALLVGGIAASTVAFAQSPTPSSVPSAPADEGPPVVVAKVGDAQVTSREVEAVVAKLPPFQLRKMGTPKEVALKITESLALQLLAEQGARAEGLHERPDVADRLRSIYASALLQDVQKNASEAAVTDEEIEAFYNANKARFSSELRIRVWQIVVGSEDEAKAILNVIKSDPEYAKDPVAGWEKLAREKSLDKGTAMRRGDLGFVRPDGSTPHADVSFPKAIYEAVAAVKDGEIVPKPVKVKGDWLILQRRGSVQTPERTLEQEKATIRGILAKQKVRDVGDALVQKLRAQYLENHHPARVDVVEIDAEGDLAPMERPGALRAAKKPAGPAEPQGVPGNLR